MRALKIFLYEWKHFFRSPFKIVALLLFIVASLYGMQNGATLYKKQHSEIENLSKKIAAEKETVLAYFEKGETGPENKPWIDVTKPYWALSNVPTYSFKEPSGAIIYNIGQAEQYGFYKKIGFSSSPYDADMAKEISNPERIQSGTLDFSFVLLFMLPLLLLVLLYNINGLEAEQGFLPLILVQTGSKNWWIVARISFYGALLLLVLFLLTLFGPLLIDTYKLDNAFWNIFLFVFSYLMFWLVIYYTIIKYGKNTISNTLQMIGVWLLFSFIIPAGVQQWVSIEKPTNLMIDIIDTKRDKTAEIYNQTDALSNQQLFELYPSLKKLDTEKNSVQSKRDHRNTLRALVNKAMKNATKTIEQDNVQKNNLITKTYWFNPITFFQNKLNKLSKTHYNDYQEYRNKIQDLIDLRLQTMVLDIWNKVDVDQEKYTEYTKKLNK